MRLGDVVGQRLLPQESLGAHGALVWQPAAVLAAHVDLQVGFAGEPLLAEAALPVLHVLVDRLDVPEELGPVREDVAALGTGKPLLGHELSRLVDVVLPRPVHGEGHRGGILGGAVLAGEGPLVRVLGSHVILEGDAVHEAAGQADVALDVQWYFHFIDS